MDTPCTVYNVHPAELGAAIPHAVQQLRYQNVRQNPSCRVISFRRAAEGTRSGQRRWEDVHVVGISISVFDVHPFSIVSGHSSLWQKTAQQGETSHPFCQGALESAWWVLFLAVAFQLHQECGGNTIFSIEIVGFNETR